MALERRYIKWYGRKDIGTGILRNLTDGGESSVGYKATKSTLELKSQNAKRQVEEGRHFLKNNPQIPRICQRKRVEDGTHHFLELNERKITCPHCGKRGQEPAMKRWHFENCKTLP